MLIILIALVSCVASERCYWNRRCPNLRHATKTPYESIRGDIRDYANPDFCEAVSIWSVARHGNRNPGVEFAPPMKRLVDTVQHQIMEAFDASRSQLCAQDIENFRKCSFNETIFSSLSQLTETGYKELFDIGKRLRLRYPQLLKGTSKDYYFRSPDEHRSMASAVAFVHGFFDGTNLSVIFEKPLEKEYLLEPHLYCPKYQQGEQGISFLEKEHTKKHMQSAEYLAVQKAVQKRLGILYKLSAEDIFTLYDICRFYRSWTPTLQDAWCAAFTSEDLDVLEYQDDLRHYYRNGYGSWVSPRLSGGLLKDLRERFAAAVRGQGKKVSSYFAHNSITVQTFSALGLFRDVALIGARRDPGRLWRSSYIAAFASNMMVVLNRCSTPKSQTHRVQFFINEKPTDLCPLSGCPWEQFLQLVKNFDDDREEICDLEYPETAFGQHGATDSAGLVWTSRVLLVYVFICIFGSSWVIVVCRPYLQMFYRRLSFKRLRVYTT